MPIEIVTVENEPNIIITRLTAPLDFSADIMASLGQLQGFLTSIEGKLYVLADCLGLDPEFSDIVVSLAEAGRPGSPLRSEQMESYIIAKGDIYAQLIDWLEQEQYGQIKVKLFESVEKAIAAAQSALHTESSE